MRITSTKLRFPSRLLGLLAVTALGTITPDAHAQSFPASDATWTVLQRGGAIITDTADAGGTNKDAVGDNTANNAVIRVHSDTSFLYFRMRVSANPISGGNYDNTSAWSCAIDTNKSISSYEFMATLNGGDDLVHWRQNLNPTDAVADPAENPVLPTFSAATHARNTLQTGTIYFVDWAVPWTSINGSGVAKGIPMRFSCGTSVSGAFTLAHDPIATVASTTITGTMSDFYVCGNSGCLRDGDGDSVPDTTEIAIGTNPALVDTDGDGINDDIELTPPGGGAFTLVNSDSDLIIDALDTDSDNDCVPDSVEGVASYRNANVPNVNQSANCTQADKPVCVQSTGTCSACTANFGGGVTGCPTAVKPQCNTSGALQGQCTACKDGATALCSGATPACESSNGTCAACNGDFGSAASAKCVQASVPACQPGNAPANLAGRCTQCTPASFALCTGTATPVCEAASGQCAKCNGDNGGVVGNLKCPTTANPTCKLEAGADFGKCFKCTSNADCGGNHAGPTCEIATGKCFDTDTDGDGLIDSVELQLGTDPTKKDTDGDGLSDLEEVVKPDGTFDKIDTDKDGIIDAKDTDSDNDGIPDGDEGVKVGFPDGGLPDAGGTDAGPNLVFRDTDGDGIPDWRDEDDDNDAILTKDEIQDTKLSKVDEDVDGDGIKNWYDTDSDGDGVTDAVEGRADNDSDGIPNYLDKTNGLAPETGPPGAERGEAGVINEADSGGPPPPPPPPEEGTLEGSSLCSSTQGVGSPFVLVIVSGLFLVALRRRRRVARRR